MGRPVSPGAQELFFILHCVPSTCRSTWRVKNIGRTKGERKKQWRRSASLSVGYGKLQTGGRTSPREHAASVPRAPRGSPEPLSSPGTRPSLRTPHHRLSAGVGRAAPQGAPRVAYFMVGQKGDRGDWAAAGGGGNRILRGAVKRNLQLILYESCSPARVGERGQMVRDGAPRGLNAVMDKTRRGPCRPQGRRPLGMGQSMKAGGSGSPVCHHDILSPQRQRGRGAAWHDTAGGVLATLLSLNRLVTSGKIFRLSGPQFSHL